MLVSYSISSATCQQTLLECCHSGLSGKSLFLLRILRPSPICTATSRKNVLSKGMAQEHWIVRFQASAEKYRGTALFWVIARRVVVISYRRFAQPIGPIFKGQRIQKKASCPNTEFIYGRVFSVAWYQSNLYDIYHC